MERIAIIGLGLIGGSIGLALKQAGLTNIEIAGTARTRDTVSRAKKLGAIDVETRTPGEAAKGARMVIIASPVMTARGIFEEIAPVLAPDAVVTDAGSTKADIARWAKELLPETAHYVGGHPMAGKETQGILAADPALFRDKVWVICPSMNAGEHAISAVVGLAQACGAEPVFMDAAEHDSYVAAVSHLPLVLASALFSVAFASAAWPELAQLASSGFRDTTRLASGSPEMAHDIMLSNKENVVHWLDRFIEELRRFRELVASGESKPVFEAFTRAQLERDNYLTNGPPQRMTGEPAEKVSLSDLLLGTVVGGYLRKTGDLPGSDSRQNGKPA